MMRTRNMLPGVIPGYGAMYPGDIHPAGHAFVGFIDPAGFTSVVVTGTLQVNEENMLEGGTVYGADDFPFAVAPGFQPAPLENWRMAHFPAGDLADPAKEATVWGNGADPDADGKNNWCEYALGGDPVDAADQGFALEPMAVNAGGPIVFRFTCPRRTNDPALTYTPAQSDDLETWHADPAYLIETGAIPLGPDFERVTVEDAGSALSATARFGRVAVQ